jgi:hypothetical protein
MSNRVQGARLKAAAAAHARKQLSALGVSFYPNSSQATFRGKTAYAAFSVTDEGVVRSFRINYPELADNALVSRREADLISAYTLHEIGHVAYTDNGAVQGKAAGLLFYLWNGIEDARIERAIIASNRARGGRTAFKRLMSKYTSAIPSEFNPASINSAPFALALVCRAAYGDGNGFAKTLLDRIPEPKRSLYAKVVDAMPGLSLARSGSAQALDLARGFLDGWDAIDPLIKQAPDEQQIFGQEPPQQLSEQPDESEDDDSVSAPSLDEDADDIDEDDLDDDINDLDDSGEGEDEDAGVSDAAANDIANTSEEAPEADSSMLDSVGDDAEDTDDGFSADALPDFDDVSEDYDANKVIKPEPDVSDVFEAINNRTRSPITLPDFLPARRSDMSFWQSLADKSDTSIRRAYKQLHKASLPALKAQLGRLLRAPERCGWDGGALGGRFDGKRSARMMAGSEAVFKRRWMSEGINTAVSVVVDLSGSMKGEAIKQSVDLAYTVAEAAESAGADVEVVGFSNAYRTGCIDGYDISGTYRPPAGRDQSTLVVAKRFNQRCMNVAHQFGLMKRIANGGTPDYDSIRTVCESLSMTKAQRKLVIVITDGYGDTVAMAKLTRSAYDLYGVDIIGFGIACWEGQFRQVYAVGAAVQSLDTLHKTVLKSVAQQLDMRDTRRIA